MSPSPSPEIQLFHLGGGVHQPEPKCHLDLKLEKFQIGQTIGSFILGGRGVSNWVNYWQFHFGEGGGFWIGELLGVSFWGGKEGGGYICRQIGKFWLLFWNRLSMTIGLPNYIGRPISCLKLPTAINVDLRDSDVIIATYPKTGIHSSSWPSVLSIRYQLSW